MTLIVRITGPVEHSNRFRARTRPKPLHRRLDVVVHRRRAEAQNPSDFLGCVSLRHEIHALTLPFAEQTNTVG